MKSIGCLLAKFWIRVVKSLVHVSPAGRMRLARICAWVFWWVVPKRRHITLTNLRICFPELSEAERTALAKRTYVNLLRAAVDHGVLWSGTKEDIQKMVRFEGLESITDLKGVPLIIITPHFVGLDAAAIALTLHITGVAMYQVQSNSAWDQAALEGHQRFIPNTMIPKSADGAMRSVVKELAKGMPLYFLPDMDYGRRHAVFIDFLGFPAATVTSTARIARMTGARACFCVAEMTQTGYVVHISKVWDDFPTDDAVADTVRIQKEIETWVRRLPDQYLWTHRRFKTRPEGEPSVY